MRVYRSFRTVVFAQQGRGTWNREDDSTQIGDDVLNQRGHYAKGEETAAEIEDNFALHFLPTEAAGAIGFYIDEIEMEILHTS